jgi:Na+-driven multidrug efflux pump
MVFVSVLHKKEQVLDITQGVIWKQLLRFFFPLLFGTVFQLLYNTVDAIIVGK